MIVKWNNFHLVELSPWPIMASLILMNLVLSIFSHTQNSLDLNNFHFVYVFLSFLILFFSWTRDITRESSYSGCHSLKVKSSIKLGMILFIVSEVMFFLSFFWSFFNFSLNPAVEMGNAWPPNGVTPINPYHIPLLNTLVLVSSGVTITYSHHMLLNNNFNFSILWMGFTIFLGIYFSLLQALEYKFCSFTIMDSSFGAIFYMATGFHGTHVIVGTMFIMSEMYRLLKYNFSSIQNLGYELSCWYWHFVDIVWLFLYLFIYWWSY